MISRIPRRLPTHLAALVMGGMALCGAGTFDVGCSGSLDDIWGYVGFGDGQEWYDDGAEWDDGSSYGDDGTYGSPLEEFPLDEYPLE